jgi:superfamily II DNA/RNA helicase
MATLEAFKSGAIDALVATDVAARGLDIPDMPCVINHELPFNAEDFIHRIGRTGRAGSSGDAIALVDASEKPLLAEIEKLMKRTLPIAPLSNASPARSGGSSKTLAEDPFFYMPYEATPKPQVSQDGVSVPASNTTQSAIKPAKRTAMLGALLGGAKKMP